MRFVILALTAVFATACGRQAVSDEAAFVVRDVRVFDGERVAEQRSVLVEGGVIARVGGRELAARRNVEVIDGRGRTLLPGLIDAHVHLSDSVAADLRQALSLGVTTVLDMFTAADRFDRIRALRLADTPAMAAVRTAGVGATAPGGHPSQMGGPPFPTVASPGEAAAFVQARVAEGSDYLKIVYDDLAALGVVLPMLDRETLSQLIAAAHALGVTAVVHVMREEQARAAIEAGADGLAHWFPGRSAAPDLARFVAGRGAFVIPTLTLLHQICGRSMGAGIAADSLLGPYIRPSLRPLMSLPPTPRDDVGSCVDGTNEMIRDLAGQGVSILTGTDAPVPGLTYGASLHGELALLVAAGLTPVQALAAATSAPARAFGLTDRGRIAPGLRADLLLVDGDATSDILATRRIVQVWKRGVPMERAAYEE